MLNRLKIYTVHIKSESEHTLENPIFVREGFNLMGFLFHFMWAFYHRLWKVGFLLMGAFILLGVLTELHVLNRPGLIVMQLGLVSMIGLHANDWLRAGLARRGYIMADIVSGDSLLRAEQRYFERYLATATH